MDSNSRTPLIFAAEYGHKAVVPELLLKRAIVYWQDDFGRTPLSYVAERGHSGREEAAGGGS